MSSVKEFVTGQVYCGVDYGDDNMFNRFVWRCAGGKIDSLTLNYLIL